MIIVVRRHHQQQQQQQHRVLTMQSPILSSETLALYKSLTYTYLLKKCM